jgi:concentrative nucleoside transporter, CNT family
MLYPTAVGVGRGDAMEHPLALRFISLLGLGAMIGIAWLLSENRRRVSLRVVLWGLGLQLALGLLILRTRAGQTFFEWVKQGFLIITDASLAGAGMVFGGLSQEFFVEGSGGETLRAGGTLAFTVLPVIILVSALGAILYHFRVTQAVVRVMTWLMRRTFKTSGAETVGVSLLVFLGIESVSTIKGYLRLMTRSELHTLMTAFMATIAASVMVAYASFGADPGHLLAASLMSAPAAILMSKLLVPETGEPVTCGNVKVNLEVDTYNVFDAAARGTSEGLQMALSVGATLISFVGLIFLLNLLFSATIGWSFTEIVGVAFRPFAFLMGVPWHDVAAVGNLLGTKTVLNEFLAYLDLRVAIADQTLSPRAITIATYALCGFANPGSVGIAIVALIGLVPERREDIVQLGLRSLIGGTLAAFSTACVAGMLLYA